jgi:DNA-directed RNA polymerase subunit RPC12/RpoP
MPISFRCPTCRECLTVENDQAGTKVACITCGQKLLVPVPAPPPKPAANNKTVLGELEPMPVPAPPAAPSSRAWQGQVPPMRKESQAPEPVTNLEIVADERPARRKRQPDEDDDFEDDDLPRRRSRRDDVGVGFRCPYCKSRTPPVMESRISTVGWIVFCAMMFLCFPLFWVAFFIKEDVRFCSSCGCKVGGF